VKLHRVLPALIACLAMLVFTNTALAKASGGGGSNRFIKVEPALIVNIGDGRGGVAFMQVNAQFKFSEAPEAQAKITHHMPAIRHILIMLLSHQTVDSMKTADGKNKVREEALKQIQALLTEHTTKPLVEGVFFTGFVIQ